MLRQNGSIKQQKIIIESKSECLNEKTNKINEKFTHVQATRMRHNNKQARSEFFLSREKK
jgi:hypothetical protein